MTISNNSSNKSNEKAQSNNKPTEIKIDLDVYNKSSNLMDVYSSNKDVINILNIYRNNVRDNWLYQKC